MNKVELLAPAGDFSCLKAAIEAGCDAVYIGGKLFGARAFSSNFTDDEIIKAINYAHLFGVKVYVTTNTLIYDKEVERFLEYISFLHKNNVDAVIIQDLGMLDLVRQTFPNLEVHASTQMHIHNLDGASFMEKLGVKRVVLARETSISKIKEIKEKTNIDIEIFIHGALCVSYSGQCLMSSLIGNRSGNRGTCAGSCRQSYSIVDENNNVVTSYEPKIKFTMSLLANLELKIIFGTVPDALECHSYEEAVEHRNQFYEIVKKYSLGEVTGNQCVLNKMYDDMFAQKGSYAFYIQWLNNEFPSEVEYQKKLQETKGLKKILVMATKPNHLATIE